MIPGKYIILEGIDGCGKSTQIAALQKILQATEKPYLFTKEPGSPHNEMCASIRSILLNTPPSEHFTMSMLFTADSYEHMSTVVKPALIEGVTVISDRCLLSDMVYHPSTPMACRKPALDLFYSLRPQVVWLQVPPKEALQRMKHASRKGLNNFEVKDVLPRMDELSKRYMERMSSAFTLERVHSMDATRLENNITQEILQIITGECNG